MTGLNLHGIKVKIALIWGNLIESEFWDVILLCAKIV